MENRLKIKGDLWVKYLDASMLKKGGIIIEVEDDVASVAGDISLIPDGVSYLDLETIDVEDITAFAKM